MEFTALAGTETRNTGNSAMNNLNQLLGLWLPGTGTFVTAVAIVVP
jgi:hypothetical protein